MNYYMHHIGDYKSDASYLSLQEHGIYFLLLESLLRYRKTDTG